MNEENTARPPRSLGCLAVSGLLLLTVVVTVLITFLVARNWLYPQAFEPVRLDAAETTVLESKLNNLSGAVDYAPRSTQPDGLRPEIYRERVEDRTVVLSQREINALIARNPELAERLVLHMSRDMLSATMLITLPPDLPMFAGQTLRVATGLRLGHDGNRPQLAIEGVSVMGVPLPSAWLGGLKGQDLVTLYGSNQGFWNAFGEGVRELRIEDGRLLIELQE